MSELMRPMLAAKVSYLDLLEYPLWVSPKLDGIRCLIDPNIGPVSRSYKPIPNDHIRHVLGGVADVNCCDGELVTYSDKERRVVDDFNTIQSKVMSQGGEPEFGFLVFDNFRNPEDPWGQRWAEMLSLIGSVGTDTDAWKFEIVEQQEVNNANEAQECWQRHVANGYEGICLRHIAGIYKFGRSTLKQQYLLKYKAVQDMEVTITGVEPLRKNTNEQTRDVFGLAERSSHKANMVELDSVGKFHVITDDGIEFSVGSGLSERQREIFWEQQDELIGRRITVMYQQEGLKSRPRFPVFKGFRHVEDS